MEGNYNNNDSENASYVTMPTTNQMMPPAALYSTEIPLTSTMLHIDTYTSNFEPNDTFSNMNTNMYTNNTYEPHITATPVVKSHNPISIFTPNQQQQHFMQQQTIFAPLETANMVTNLNNMEIDEYFAPPPPLNMDNAMFNNTMQNVYSPSSTSVTTNNSSIMFMDSSISPSSPINMMSPINQQNMSNSDYPMDSFAPQNYPMLTDNNQMYSEVPIVPTDIGMYPQYNVLPYNDEMVSFPQQQSPYVERRRPLPRRHTVSTPYNNKDAADNTPDVPQTPTTKSRKSSLKSKRHRSLGKLEMYSSTPDSEQLETWSHQQLLDRIQQLEKEKVVGQNKQDDSGVKSVKSASHSEVEDDDDEDHVCQWDTCSLEFNTLNDLILHVKTDHIGSGKANYYCCWKDCARKQKPFTKRHKMHNHLRTHTGERPFVCEEPDCGKRFSRLDSLTTHSKIHSNIRPYLCSFADCGKAYYHLRSLRKHERSHTAVDKSATPPPPLPTTSFGEENQVFTDWGLSAQAAVLNVMNRDSFM